jgi:methionine biosynthesis protein MetW
MEKQTTSSIGEKFHQIAGYIPAGSTVLDIGCGAGQLALALRNKNCVVDGMDLNLNRVAVNRSSYRTLFEQDIESFDFTASEEKYDVVIFSDVLEHLQQADRVLREAKGILSEDGKLVISLPNVGYYSNRLGLLLGHWEYQDEGILDRTHLRFFTLASAKRFIRDNGFSVHTIEAESPVISSSWKRFVFQSLSHNFPSLFAIGWVFVAVPE